jgi:hypothetical protein
MTPEKWFKSPPDGTSPRHRFHATRLYLYYQTGMNVKAQVVKLEVLFASTQYDQDSSLDIYRWQPWEFSRESHSIRAEHNSEALKVTQNSIWGKRRQNIQNESFFSLTR